MTALYCQKTGLKIANLECISSFGALPYAAAWKESIFYHPCFSLPPVRLLAFARSEQRKLARIEDPDATNLRAAFVAILDQLGSIEFKAPCLPEYEIVQTNLPALFALAYWKFQLESKRFKFPTYRITKETRSLSGIKAYLDLCFEIKHEYETSSRTPAEAMDSFMADNALKKLRSGWVAPITNKELFKWVRAYLPAKYEADAQGWMATLFLGSEKKILLFEKEDIQLLIDIILSECPAGTGMMKAVEERLNLIQKTWADNKEAFSVDFEEMDLEEELIESRSVSAAPASTEEPKEKDFPNKVAYIKARAFWYLNEQKKKAAK
jgi:hypothetical protein